MTTEITTTGLAHISERDAGDTTFTYAFDGLFFGQGNDVPGQEDTLAEIGGTGNEDLLNVRLTLDSGYPIKGDSDPDNPGAGDAIWTWRFTRVGGEPFVASNVAICSYSGGEPTTDSPLLVHSRQVVAQRYDEQIKVFVNASATTDPTVYVSASEYVENRTTRVESFTARTRASRTWPQGSAIDSTVSRCRPQPGQAVWTAAHQVGLNGQRLQVVDVEDFTLRVEEYRASTGQWTAVRTEYLDTAGHVFGAEQRYDQRWTAPGGYNVSHSWQPEVGETEGTFRLVYEMLLTDNDVRKWSTIVEVKE